MSAGYGSGSEGRAIGSTNAPSTALAVSRSPAPLPMRQPLPENQTRREMLEKAILETQQRIGRLDAELQEAHRLLEASQGRTGARWRGAGESAPRFLGCRRPGPIVGREDRAV